MTTESEEDPMTDREETQDAPVMDGATEAAPQEKKAGAQEQRSADAAVEDDLRSIRAYGEDR
ncbi:hypothetical protein MTES_0868 [Microbacterium testaceum StLB037]|uniref:Uncharacterized protein n=2 Tax=Microbacterium testaceum TaxID=2033 RepID=E8NEG6_MICTS|nr:hypothetical protein MTES_0868 [Microbacterium testaceum StLB037]